MFYFFLFGNSRLETDNKLNGARTGYMQRNNTKLLIHTKNIYKGKSEKIYKETGSNNKENLKTIK